MNNKQKRKYMNDLLIFQSMPFLCEFNTRGDFLKQTPTVLYKYRSFDKYAFLMIKNDYAYLAPVAGLDDPFDCLNDFGYKDYYDEKTHKITPKAVETIVKQACPNGIQGYSFEETKKLALECVEKDGLDYDKIPKIVKSSGSTTKIEPEPLFTILSSINENFDGIIENTKLTNFAERAKNPGENVGVLSLSEVRDNKVMWSLYGKKYTGYCIEYEIPKIKDVVFNLCPVIYTKRNNNNFMVKMLEYFMGAMMRAVTNGHVNGNIGAATELFRTKDTDWKYQQEWRIIGKAENHLKGLKIKAIYLGFKVCKTNEEKMKRYARKYKFDLYKMNPPYGKKMIKYRRIFNGLIKKSN